MKHKLLFLLLLVLVAGAGISVKVFVIDADSRRVGYMQVSSTPNATVFLDSRAIGRTPLNQQLKPGIYTLKLIPIADNLDTQETIGVTWQGKVTIAPYQRTHIRRELRNTEVESAGEQLTIQKSSNSLPPETGEILIETEPDGAIVSVDGQDLGVSPYMVKKAQTGLHEVSVHMPRFRRRTIQARVVSGGYTTVAHFQLGLDIEYDKKFAFGKAFEASASGSLPSVSKAAPRPTSIPQVEKVEIKETSTGFLRVRSEGSLAGKEISQVKPGETYTYLDEKNGWIKIKLTDGNEGWVNGEYVKKIFAKL